MGEFLEMHQVMKYLLDKKSWIELGAKQEQKKPWDFVCFNSSDYAGDPVMRRNMNGFIVNQRQREA